MPRPSSRRKLQADSDNFDFEFQFHASQVPNQGWDKLVVALIPCETGRATVKTAKGHVRNGTCDWPDYVIESATIMLDPVTREYNEKMYTIVVSMGSLRTGVLGETSINVTEFIHANTSESVALPLKNCNAGTILHVRIRCLMPRTGVRELDPRKDANADQGDESSISDGDEGGYDLSGNNTSGSLGSSASQTLISLGQMKEGKHWQREGASSIVTSRYNYDSSDSLSSASRAGNGNSKGILAGDALSSTGSAKSLPLRQDSGGSTDGGGDKFLYSQSSKNQGVAGRSSKGWQDSYLRQGDSTVPNGIASVPENGAAGSPHLFQRGRNRGLADLEAAEATIKELRADGMTWERQANKLNLEVEILKQQLTAERRHATQFRMEVSALEAERDGLRLEVGQLKAAKLSSEERGSGDGYSRWVAEDSLHAIEELQEEITHEKETNLNLNLQLRKIQDSNVELVSVVTELEGTMEQQCREIERLTEVNDKLEASIYASKRGDGQLHVDFEEAWRMHFSSTELEWGQKLLAFETDVAQRLASQIVEVKLCQDEISRLQQKTEQKKYVNVEEIGWRNKWVVSESEWMDKLSLKEEELKNLKAEVARLQMIPSMINEDNAHSEAKSEEDHSRTIEILKKNMNELDKDCKELTDENMDLVYKLRRSNKELEEKTQLVLELEQRLESKIREMEPLLRLSEQSHGNMAENQRLLDDLHFQVKILDENNSLLNEQLQRSTEEVESLRSKIDVEEKELEHHLANLEKERLQFSERILDLETQLRHALDERELHNSHLHNEKIRLDVAYQEAISKQEQKTSGLEQKLADALKEAENYNQARQRLENELDQLKEENAKMASEALAEVSRHQKEKLELEGCIKQMDENIRQAEVEAASMNEKLGDEIKDMAGEKDAVEKQQKDLKGRMQDVKAVDANDKLKIQKFESMLTEVGYEEEDLGENIGLDYQFIELEKIRTEMGKMTNMLEEVKSEKLAAESSFHKVTDQCTQLQAEKTALIVKLTAVKATISEVSELRHSKSALEEKLHHLQSILEVKETARIPDVEQQNESICLKSQVNEFQSQMTEQDTERDEFKRRVQSLEEELQLKADALTRAEKQLKEREKYTNSNDLQERLKFLEEEITVKEEELEVCKKVYREKEAELYDRIECLEVSNEQLAMGQSDAGLEQLRTELIRLQNQNSIFSRREQELLSKLSMQDIFESEVQRLQEENEHLEARLMKFTEAVKYPNLLEKVTTLEIELAEALEVNNMYKLQLRSVFEKQQNVNMAALQGLGDSDQVISEFLAVKKKAAQLEVELREMKERYMLMSLKFAEVEAERSELVMAIKNLKKSKKP